MSRIVIHGKWMYAWMLWITSFLAWMIYGPLHQDFVSFHLGLCVIFTWWFFLEMAGAADLSNDTGTEKAKTLSQFGQYVAIHLAKPSNHWYQGWKALITGFAALISIAAGILFWPVHWSAGVVAGVAVFAWNQPHWTWRHRFG